MADQTPAQPEPRYDYTRQCWIVDGKIAPCGHPAHLHPGCCYAGQHAGEPADTPYTLERFAADLAELAGAILTGTETEHTRAARARMTDPRYVLEFPRRQPIPAAAPFTEAQSRATDPQQE